MRIEILLIIILTSGLVVAAGSSTGSYSQPASNGEVDPESCEAPTGMKARISCRLETGESEGIPETCRSVDQEPCIALYEASVSCYDLPASQKDACFWEAATDENYEQHVRKYVVLLLYDLQERVEMEYEQTSMSTNDAADLITSIVLIKQQALSGYPVDRMHDSIMQLQESYNGVMR